MTLPNSVSRPRALQATLRKITEALACELAQPSARVPDWNDMEWLLARAVAAMHGVSPLLARHLRWRGPVGWSEFLDEQRQHTAQRHVRVQQQLQQLDARSRAAGFGFIALKGAALHALGVYEPGDRPMADIDLLVNPAAEEPASEMLKSLGLREILKNWKERVYVPDSHRAPAALGEHADNDIKVELHVRICEKLPWRMTDISAAMKLHALEPGLNPYPSRAALMTHLLLHAAGAISLRALRLLHLQDIARLSESLGATDWQELLGTQPDKLWWAHPPLQLAVRYCSTAVPADVLETLRTQCPPVLAKLSARRSLPEVSYSYPWVEAFPGIGWSLTWRDACQYAYSRIRPAREHAQLRERTADGQGWAADGQWTRLSQARRMLRWVTSKPMRPQTWHAISAALAPP